ncbi:MAG TPA: M20/M25/M40 family metallo-hydrolase [Vicinamibacterales bacterium]|jgi:acetylornithine deacetylase/succinyl-diaminopimelate desuccinylase-like protein|nr:M20/M25/M40 family metallo-hydrolase [Vicinamibacterales bacterium]
MVRRRLSVLAAALAAAWSLGAQGPASNQPGDWDRLRPEILEHYRDLVRIDSTPGRETLVVNYLKRVLEAEGIPTQTFALDPDRANLVARLKGSGSKRPVLILAHTDVVPVQREKWPVDPFGAELKDGYIWGRGTKDDKPVLAANLMTMLLLKRRGVVLDRDVIFLAESAEEADTTGAGINFMVREHFDAIDAEFAITEGGAATLDGSRVTRVSIGTAEKLPARARLVATGTAGHGSVPRLDNPLLHLAAAIDKLGRWQTPMRLNDTTRTYFQRLATIAPPDRAAAYRTLVDPKATAAAMADAQRYLQEHDPASYAMLRTSIVPTILRAGVGANVIPSEAEATLDIRALPGEDTERFYAQMREVIADPAVKVVPIPQARPPSPASRIDTEMYRVLEQVAQRMYPGSTVLPGMSTGASDQAQLRAKGIQSYGVGPAATEEDALNYPAHGDVERLAESSLYPFVQYVYTVVTEVAARK